MLIWTTLNFIAITCRCFPDWEDICTTLDLNSHLPKPPPEEKETKGKDEEKKAEKEGDNDNDEKEKVILNPIYLNKSIFIFNEPRLYCNIT